MTKMMELFEAARRRSVPIVSIGTADQNATVQAVVKEHDASPIVQWDAVRGITKVNKAGEAAIGKSGIKPDETAGFVEAMMALRLFPQATILLAHNAHRQLQAQEPLAVAASVQAVANLRDELKKNFRMLVLMGPDVKLPLELSGDTVALQHELPTPEEIEVVVRELHASAKLPNPTPDVMRQAVDASTGLSMFAVEQNTAMSLGEEGLIIDRMWETKRTTIEQTPGLSVWRGKERFSDVIGLDAIKAHLTHEKNGRLPIGVNVWMDEIDKVFTGHSVNDSKADQLKTLLTEMDNNGWRGVVLVGVSGGGKSLIPKAFGNEAGVPTIGLDLGGMESKWQGESEQQLRAAMKVIKAIGRGNAYFIATSNGASVMRPELQRRFTGGMWMFDLMTEVERAATWKFYMKKYGLADALAQFEKTGSLGFDDNGWTGAEIRNCCRYAWNASCTLAEASQFIVPMARSRGEEIERLRTYAHGRLLDASKPGSYRYNAEPMEEQIRAIDLSRTQVVDLSGLKGVN